MTILVPEEGRFTESRFAPLAANSGQIMTGMALVSPAARSTQVQFQLSLRQLGQQLAPLGMPDASITAN